MVQLGIKAKYRQIEERGETHILREPGRAYVRDSTLKSDTLRLDNTYAWNENAETAKT